MGWKIKVNFDPENPANGYDWIQSITHDSVAFVKEESAAFEFNKPSEVGYYLNFLKRFHPNIKIITKPVLRIVK